MKRISCSAFIPIIVPFSNQELGFLEKAIINLLEIKHITFSLEDYGNFDITFDLIDKIKNEPEFKRVYKKTIRKEKIIKISITCPIQIPDKITVWSSKREKEELDGENAIMLHKAEVRSLFEKKIYDLFLVSNIAYPGTLQFFTGYIFIDNLFSNTIGGFHTDFLNDVSNYAIKQGWPLIKHLDIFLVWKWAIKQTDFLYGLSQSSLGRAINAFSYLFKYEDENVFDLFWALIGVEALYAKGNVMVKEQVYEKCQLFLGQFVQKKKFNEMYNLRSRLIHGDLNFSREQYIEEFYDDKEDSIKKSYEARNLALAILISTLQKLVELDKDNLIYSFILED